MVYLEISKAQCDGSVRSYKKKYQNHGIWRSWEDSEETRKIWVMNISFFFFFLSFSFFLFSCFVLYFRQCVFFFFAFSDQQIRRLVLLLLVSVHPFSFFPFLPLVFFWIWFCMFRIFTSITEFVFLHLFRFPQGPVLSFIFVIWIQLPTCNMEIIRT